MSSAAAVRPYWARHPRPTSLTHLIVAHDAPRDHAPSRLTTACARTLNAATWRALRVPHAFAADVYATCPLCEEWSYQQ